MTSGWRGRRRAAKSIPPAPGLWAPRRRPLLATAARIASTSPASSPVSTPRTLSERRLDARKTIRKILRIFPPEEEAAKLAGFGNRETARQATIVVDSALRDLLGDEVVHLLVEGVAVLGLDGGFVSGRKIIRKILRMICLPISTNSLPLDARR